MAEEDRHFVTALARGLTVLACFRAADGLLGNQELARRTGLPKSTVSRLTGTLARLGYLSQPAGSHQYRLGAATLALGQAPLMPPELRAAARGPLQELADATGAEAALGVRVEFAMLYAEHCNCSTRPIPPDSLHLGSRVALGTSAMGMAWLAALPEAQRRETLAQLAALRGADVPLLESAAAQAVHDHATLGVACAFGTWRASVNAVARAFRPRPELPPVVVNCGGAARSFSQAFLLREVRPRLIDTVARLEDAMGR